MERKFYSGFVSIIGRSNVGKSTLLNCFAGDKVAIISNRPQTTRNRIRAIITKDNYQIIFTDTPGIHKAKSKLGHIMNNSAESSINDADAVLFLINPSVKLHEDDMGIIEKLRKSNKKSPSPVFLVINKIDLAEKPKLLKIIENFRQLYEFKAIVPISALNADNTDTLFDEVKKCLPEGPKYFPDDALTDRPERYLVGEFIREKTLYLLDEEIPHGIAVEINSMKQRENSELIDIDANICCEKDSHKGIIIGKGGAMLKNIGIRARSDIERALGSPVNLQLWVKVKKDWRNNDFLIRDFGFGTKS